MFESVYYTQEGTKGRELVTLGVGGGKPQAFTYSVGDCGQGVTHHIMLNLLLSEY